MIVAAGIDVGSSAVKCAVVRAGEGGAGLDRPELLATTVERIRRRDPRAVIDQVYGRALGEAAVRPGSVDYVATTGDGDLVDFRRGHFYGMTAHARGALHLVPRARAALDVGSLHARAVRMDERGKVLGYRMTSQCASGSGQFLENIARYLGVTLEEIGEISLASRNPEKVSSICAVLAETDVINMASRGISTPDILKGIHLSMAGRFVKLLAAAGVKGPVLVTGGLASDTGLVETMREEARKQKLEVEVLTHALSVQSGAVGAAIWGAFRHERLLRREERAAGEGEDRFPAPGQSPGGAA